MINRKHLCTAIGILGSCGGAATAQVHYGQPIIIQDEPHAVSVHYMSASTSYDGVLWLAGTSIPSGIDTPLFFNHSGELGFEHYLGGFQVGDRLDFIYDVLTGAPDSFRTDDLVESMQFRWRWDTPDIILVEIEDVRLPGGDWDYNDMRFEVRMLPIPGPGAGVALAMAGFLGVRRRRSW